MIEMNGERELRKSMQGAWHDDDDDDDIYIYIYISDISFPCMHVYIYTQLL